MAFFIFSPLTSSTAGKNAVKKLGLVENFGAWLAESTKFQTAAVVRDSLVFNKSISPRWWVYHPPDPPCGTETHSNRLPSLRYGR